KQDQRQRVIPPGQGAKHKQQADRRQALQQARLLGVAGKVDEAIAAYEKLYGGVPDDVDVAIEYRTPVARLPPRHSEGVSQLKKLNASAPGNVSLLTSLAKQM
ncbi:hypothetical protein JTM22_39045, partial [Pseudomonas aeruginosa]|nr:hypothetical protein [Pseudomonas aeruginosa]